MIIIHKWHVSNYWRLLAPSSPFCKVDIVASHQPNAITKNNVIRTKKSLTNHNIDQTVLFRHKFLAFSLLHYHSNVNEKYLTHSRIRTDYYVNINWIVYQTFIATTTQNTATLLSQFYTRHNDAPNGSINLLAVFSLLVLRWLHSKNKTFTHTRITLWFLTVQVTTQYFAYNF